MPFLPRIPTAANRYFSKICSKHPEDLGLRYKRNGTCVQCSKEQRTQCAARQRAAFGWKPRKLYTREEAAARIRQRDKIRNAKRRLDPTFNAAQIDRKRRWRISNREKHLKTNRAYDTRQLKENLQRRISKNLRHRVYKAMLGKTRGVSAVRQLGISIPEFKDYIERQFTDGMSWDNYGKWHLDHKIPLKAFNLTDKEQALAACHYTNYQPLWAIDNIRKHNKIGDKYGNQSILLKS